MPNQGDNKLLEEARLEAYASATHGDVILHAVELNHPVFRGQDPIRVIRWPVVGPEPQKFHCLLEDTSPEDAGQVKTFVGFPFELKLPEISSENNGTFEGRFGYDTDIDAILMDAAQNPGVITMHYRQYVLGRELEGPVETWAGIEVQNPRREGGMITFNGQPLPWLNRGFSKNYTKGEFPMLQ